MNSCERFAFAAEMREAGWSAEVGTFVMICQRHAFICKRIHVHVRNCAIMIHSWGVCYDQMQYDMMCRLGTEGHVYISFNQLVTMSPDMQRCLKSVCLLLSGTSFCDSYFIVAVHYT